MTKTPEPSPAEAEVAAITARLRAAMGERAPAVTLAALIRLLGPQSHILVILVFCILNMIPGPPGYGGTMAAAIFFFAMAMVRDQPMRVPDFLGNRRIPAKLLVRMLGRLAQLSGMLARISRPRLAFLAGPATHRPIGMFIMALCVPMTVPIPFMNAIPNVGLTVICLALLNRDGAGVGMGVVLAVLGVAIDIAIIVFVVSLGLMAGDALTTA